MKIKDYPYGKPSKSLKKAADYLNRNYIKIINEFISDENNQYKQDLDYLMFEYPDYLGLDKRIGCALDEDDVFWLDEEFDCLKFRYKDSIRSKLNPKMESYVLEARKILDKIDKEMPLFLAVN
jgi:hypothetical protein